MPGRKKYQLNLVFLGIGTLAMAAAMAVLLVFEIAQRNSIRDANESRADSVVAMAFQCEREFLRFRRVLGATVNSRIPPPHEELTLRYEIFQSRLSLLKDNPSISVLEGRDEYLKLAPKLNSIVQEADAVFAQATPQPRELGVLLAHLDALGPDMQSLSMAATSTVTRQLENQDASLLEQTNLIIGLTVLQLLLLMVAATALAWHQKQQEAKQQELERINAHLQVARVKADAANLSKSQFLATMSHELRTPFNGLMGMLLLLEGTTPSAQQLDYIKTAQSSSQHLLSLLNDVLDYSSLESGNLKIRVEPTDLKDLIHQLNDSMRLIAESKGLKYSPLVLQDKWPQVFADSSRIKQILFNLVSNAIKFTHHGGVEVKFSGRIQDGGYLAFQSEVSDTGIGIDRAGLAQLFQRFHQIDAGVDRQFGGVGLGLEISQSLAQLMGGSISVRSELGKGSVFTLNVTLKICPVEPKNSVENPHDVKRASEDSKASENRLSPADLQASGPNILVVEDHAINRKLIGVLLERMGCKVVFCEDGQQSVDIVQVQRFDAILMDVNMPVMDGLTATRTIRAMGGEIGATPIIVFTADVMNEARDRAANAGANDFLPKPVQISSLRTVLKNQLPHHNIG
jgi:signal transduction histidine kinase/ActR/RegA family two-component response regulator